MRQLFISSIAASLIFIGLPTAAKKAPTPPADISISDIALRLETIGNFSAHASMTVSMAQMSDDISYKIELLQQTADSDRLATAPYLIEWQPTESDHAPGGFSAYYNGNYFNFAGDRLQEYHLERDSISFCPKLIGLRSEGIHRATRFFNILPQGIAGELRRLAADSTCIISLRSDTLVSGRPTTAIRADRCINGILAAKSEYLFDPLTFLPRRISVENSPVSISEQSVIVDFTDCRSQNAEQQATAEPISEKWLAERYPLQFSRLRKSIFSIENLPGQRLPGFALPTTTGERYARRAGDPLRAPTIIALLEADAGSSAAAVASLREAVDRLRGRVDIIWAFTDNIADRIEPVVGQLRPGEHLLMNARSLAVDCGADSLPAFILTGRDGNVVNVIIGCNNDLVSDVILKMAVAD